MQIFRCFGLAAVIGLAICCGALAVEPDNSLQSRLPRDTLAYVRVRDFRQLQTRLARTGPGRMVRDEKLQAFLGGLIDAALDYQFPASSLAQREGQRGIAAAWRDAAAAKFGEIVLALVAGEDDSPTLVLLIDAGESVDTVRQLSDSHLRLAEQRGGTRVGETHAAGRLTVVAQREQTLAAVAQQEDVFLLSDDAELLRTLLRGWQGGLPCVADNPQFARWSAAAEHAPGEADVELFVDIQRLQAMLTPTTEAAAKPQASTPARQRERTVRTESAAAALGVQLFVDSPPYDLLVEGVLLLATPRRDWAKLVALRSGDAQPEAWVPAIAATYSTVYCDLPTMQRALADSSDRQEQASYALAEQLAAAGVGSAKDCSGLLPHLSGRYSHASWLLEEPALTTNAWAEVHAVQVQGREFATLLQTTMQAQGEAVRTAKHGGVECYEISVENFASAALLPPMCVALLDDHLLIANQPAALVAAIEATRDPARRLAEQLDYRLVASKRRRLAGDSAIAAAFFARPSETVRRIHRLLSDEELRLWLKLTRAQSPLNQVLLKTLENHPLPELADFERHLAPCGGLLIDDGEALRATIFMQRRR